ncbi:uncharacterized protein LOC124916895 [Impatiens glandulifera]|uniref:uncharacterized protein LOC124916895 n=1 Tax=Impatiens glandulifera TaxID=253017 RepID=UPI001FB1079B|nr:uncharacterized protein LOC124916895 [Impatiens glandulifera]
MELTQKPISTSRKGPISLETYIEFIRSDKQSILLPVQILTQIIRMHGFVKCSAPKTTLMEVLKVMELMDPCRSTLNQEKISPIVMTMEQILKDIDDLKWNECCITSIQTLNPVDVDSVLNDTPEVSSLSNQRCSSKSKSLAGVKTKSNDLNNGGGAGGSQPTDIDLLMSEFIANKKKKNTEAGEISNTSSNHLTKRVRRSTK